MGGGGGELLLFRKCSNVAYSTKYVIGVQCEILSCYCELV